MKFLNGAVGRVTPCAPSWRIQTPTLASSAPINPGFLVGSPRRAAHCPPYLPSPFCASAPSRLCVKTPASSHNQASIKAKTPAIKAHQALSRQMPFFVQPTHWMRRTGSPSSCTTRSPKSGSRDPMPPPIPQKTGSQIPRSFGRLTFHARILRPRWRHSRR